MENPSAIGSVSLGPSTGGWIQWLCSLVGHEYLVEVDEEFIRDPFNLYNLRSFFNDYDAALEMILNDSPPNNDDLHNESYLEIYHEAYNLYGLIHSRYIQSSKGLALMRQHYLRRAFGYCPRVMCLGMPVLPIGLVNDLHLHRVRIYCPLCQEIYSPSTTSTQYQLRNGTAGAGGGAGASAKENGRQDKKYDDEEPSSSSLDDDEEISDEFYQDNSYRKKKTTPVPQSTDIDGAFFGTSFPHFFLQAYSDIVPAHPPAPAEPRIFGFKVHRQLSIIQNKLYDGEYGRKFIPAR